MTVLVDTSVWIDHLRRGNADLADLLSQGAVIIHPYVVGELACGNLRNRREILTLLQALPMASVLEHEEALEFLDDKHLHGRGLGWIDVHLLASARLENVKLWSLDKALVSAAASLGIERGSRAER
ncbi:MAG: PIN domain-containing protein [Candidatus Eisenbacteria bacterium]|nr:PIN domain-containing protein [Candidatus Eisenbacteria bacterium]